MWEVCVLVGGTAEETLLLTFEGSRLTVGVSRYARGGDSSLSGTFLPDGKRLQFPRLHQEPVHQPRAAGFHPRPHEAGGSARLPALPPTLLRARHLPAEHSTGNCYMYR